MMSPAGTSPNKILLISYHYPPSSAVGGLRIANYSRFIQLFGWKPFVLTIKDSYIAKLDVERLNEFHNDNIFKAGKTCRVQDLYILSKNIAYKLLNKSDDINKKKDDNTIAANNIQEPVQENEKIYEKLRRYILAFMSLPDSDRNWVLPASMKAIRLIKKMKVDCILTSGPPHSVHLIGWIVKKMTGVRWVADFRDPWVTTKAIRAYVMRCALSERINQWMEKKAIAAADLVVTSTKPLCDALIKRYHGTPNDKFVHIPNGYDSEYFHKYDDMQKYKEFTLTHAGSIYFDRSPEPIFKSLIKLIDERKILLADVRVKLIGDCRTVGEKYIKDMVKSYGLEHVVDVIDTIPYSQAVEIIKRSHLALLFAPDQPFQIPAKIYDYMGVGTKILAICNEGATSDLVDETGIGRSFSPEDIEGITEYIFESIKCNSNDGDHRMNESAIKKYERKNIVLDFVGHLNQICDR